MKSRSSFRKTIAVVPMTRVWLLVSLVLLLLTPHAHSMIVCPKKELAFFHIPKTGGIALNEYLKPDEENDKKPWKCYVIGWGISGAYAEPPNSPRKDKMPVVRFDAAHVTPAELEFWVFQGVGFLKDWSGPDAPHLADISPQELVHDWNTFTIVRNPYLRVLGAYAQRQVSFYDDVWGEDYPRGGLAEFMRYLEHNLVETKTFSWCCTPSIIHFRPSTLYTHWANDFPAIKTVLKLEEIDTGFPRFMSRFYNHSVSSLSRGNQKDNSETRRGLCHRASGCVDEDLQMLLNSTEHTEETIRITNRLYRRDFELLGYNMLLRDDADEIKDKQDRKGVFGISVEEVENILTTQSGNHGNRTAEKSPEPISCQVELPVENTALPWRLLVLCLIVLAYREKRRLWLQPAV